MKKRKIIAGIMAAILSIGMFGACGTKKEENGVTEISWYLSGVKLDSSYDDVWNKLNEYLTEKYNMKLNVVLTDAGNFAQKMQMMNASRESYDLVFTSNWRNNYYTNIENGSLYDLTEILPKHAPKLYESLEDYVVDAAKVDGKIYAVPNWQVQARAMGVLIPEEALDASGYTMDQINSLEDLEGYYDAITKARPDLVDVNTYAGGSWISAMANYGMMMVTQEGLPGAIYFDKEGKPEIINQYETDEFMEFAKLVRSWVEKGYYPSVRTVRDKSNSTTLTDKGGFDNWKPGAAAEKSKDFKMVDKQISPAVLATESICAAMTGVSANSKHPEKAVEMMEIMYTDKYAFNLLCFGIEGVNYDKVGENTIKLKEESTYSMQDWAIGSVANSYIIEGKPETIWEDTKKFNESAIVSPLMGFTLDNSEISAELGNCETVVKEYIDTIQFGLEDPETIIPKFIEDLKVAGADVILEKVQSQIDVWWEANKE